ncbi:hypothetical protein LTR70_006984 [Exophiala xenobiotica]|uniref:Photolyase/cryptochrome alpha/beta domain-containing protein n=1 Tax=Lithohypha guttulata TaxID=1690604 RepID=A0ABR0K5T1_9EURO|nr:hypothetical protein LTR24_006476 [Lithohypha guttulata]KAK5314871.1 hypothetical protein LTR70_006984 [Exophiala xenobiotica]
MAKRKEPATPIEHPELKHPSTQRAKEVDGDTPYNELKELLESQKTDRQVEVVLHWFRSKDLRIYDNRALHDAAETAKEADAPLICAYLHCPAELNWHGTSPARTDFIIKNLQLIQQELKELDIPLVFLEASERNKIVPTIVDFIKDNEISHVFANYEYEVDELRRDLKLLKHGSEEKFQVALRHDQTVVEPLTILTGSGKPMKVFTPYHKAWCAEVAGDPTLLDTVPAPSKNSSNAKKKVVKLFESKAPKAPKEKQFVSNEERDRIRNLWPAGHKAGIDRMQRFVDQIDNYAATRSNPAKNSTSRMSPYFAAGVVSVREVLQLVKKYNGNSADFSQSAADPGVYGWVREIVFRELYRQTLLDTPHMSMSMPTNLKFDFVHWEDDEEGYKRWEEGTLGVPFVDAGMRQISTEKYMHNRLRMNVSSYLYCNLLINYRRGERFFASTGWEPSYTVFNPVSQAEKNDPDGEYIRKWIPELRGVKGKAVFDPYHRLPKEEFEKLGYPAPYVDWSETKARAIERFKSDMRNAEP